MQEWNMERWAQVFSITGNSLCYLWVNRQQPSRSCEVIMHLAHMLGPCTISWIAWLKFSVIFLSLVRHMLLEVGQGCFLTSPFQFIVSSYSLLDFVLSSLSHPNSFDSVLCVTLMKFFLKKFPACCWFVLNIFSKIRQTFPLMNMTFIWRDFKTFVWQQVDGRIKHYG